ncbi:hypothetical protein HFV04_013030 [Pseudomonas sp. BIGb0427]|uniref:hypothetical protein n=1 Tax=unclassified Pseudomonas TaxID=196821 RepID=UPI0016BC1343|nr:MULTISPECIES: hypothetical protein [unclassified Pseudomonas]NLU59126.1 hypothetical protein [Pseudomonas sp. BIGb0427]QPG65654.1 hypothetical protein HFV04_013030 [Pseudomonas sp. BIGb0427]UVM57167.1 hypothetical protein LOY37_06155 [Pseudomonas sp. B21-012]UVM68101.1 hypothetical protein LOY34_06085 [Pseudomonas sp. B21-009]
MSLETDVANLVTKTTDLISYFNGKKAGIDAAVAAAVAAVPNMERTWFVDYLAGDDQGAGNLQTPFKTINKAVASTPVGGACNIRLMSDYTHSGALVVSVDRLNICSDTPGVKRKFNMSYYLGADGNNGLSGFALASSSSLGFLDLTLTLPSPAGITPAPGGTANVMLKSYSTQITSSQALKFAACDVQMAADFGGWLMLQHVNAVILQAVSTNFSSTFPGRYIFGVAAGTPSKDLSNVLTNLATL